MTDQNRRQFLSTAGAAVVAIPAASLIGSRLAFAADVPMVDATSAQAVALQYVEATATEGQMCSNCALYQAEDGAEAGMCPLFQGVQVGGNAWCSAWAPKG